VHSTRRRKQLILTYTLYESSDFWGLKIGDKLICMEKMIILECMKVLGIGYSNR
jgi:hypothetical protein